MYKKITRIVPDSESLTDEAKKYVGMEFLTIHDVETFFLMLPDDISEQLGWTECWIRPKNK